MAQPKMQSFNRYKLAENLKANENPFVSWKKTPQPQLEEKDPCHVSQMSSLRMKHNTNN